MSNKSKEVYKLILIYFLLLGSRSYCQLKEYDFNNVCDFIAFNKSNECYLSTINGLYFFSGFDLHRLKLNTNGNQNFQSKSFWTDPQNLWITTYDRLINYNHFTRSEKYFQIKENGIAKNSDYYLFDIIKEQNILLLQNENVYNFNSKTCLFDKLAVSVSGRRLKKIDCLSKNIYKYCNYYYSNEPGILELSIEGCSNFTFWKNWDSKEMLQDICSIDSNYVLMASNRNLYLGNLSNKLVLPINEFPIRDILCCQTVSKNTYWVSSKKHGLFEFSLDKNRIFNLKKLPFETFSRDNPVNRIEINSDSTIILSSFGSKIFTFNKLSIKFNIIHQKPDFECGIILNNEFIAVDKSNKISTKKISSNAFDKRTVKVVGKDNNNISTFFRLLNLRQFDKVRKIENRTNGIRDSKVYRIFIDDSLNLIYSIYRGDLVNNTTHKNILSENKLHKTINYFSKLIDDKFLISENSERIYIWDTLNKTEIFSHVFSAEISNHIYFPKEGIIYLSTSQGLFQISIRDATINKVLANFNLQLDECNCILKYHDFIWGTTRNKIFKFNLNSKSLSYYNFSYESDKIEFIRNGCINYRNDGFFIYNNGKIKIDLDKQSQTKNFNKIHLFDLKINDKSYKFSNLFEFKDSLVLNYDNNTFSFKLVISNLVFENNTFTQYQLLNKDFDWITVENPETEIRYSNLQPGEYVFKVFVKEDKEVLEERTVFFNILPPFWMTWWFRLGSIFSLLTLSFLGIRTYYRRQLERKNLLLRQQQLIIEKQEAVEKERTRIASEMHDDLGSGLTTIRYLSDRALSNVKSDEEKQQIGKIAEQSNALVRNMSEIIWAMNSRFDTLDNLISYIRRYAFEYLEQFNIKIGWASDEIPELKITGTERRNVFLVCKEILHNIVKHAKANQVEFKIGIAKDKLSIAIKDNGIGFDPSVSEEKGNGLYNMRKRMEQIGGRMEFVGKVDGAEVILSIALIV